MKHAIGSGGICKTALNPAYAAAGVPQYDQNAPVGSRLVDNRNSQWSVPLEAGAGALAGGLGAYGLYRGLGRGAVMYGFSDKASRSAMREAGGLKKFVTKAHSSPEYLSKVVDGMGETGVKRMGRSAKFLEGLKKAKLPLAGLGMAAGAALAARHAMKHNDELQQGR